MEFEKSKKLEDGDKIWKIVSDITVDGFNQFGILELTVHCVDRGFSCIDTGLIQTKEGYFVHYSNVFISKEEAEQFVRYEEIRWHHRRLIEWKNLIEKTHARLREMNAIRGSGDEIWYEMPPLVFKMPDNFTMSHLVAPDKIPNVLGKEKIDNLMKNETKWKSKLP